MKKVRYILPELDLMELLLKNIDKDTKKIAKIKDRTKFVWDFPNAMEKISRLNLRRFSNILSYHEVCNNLLDQGLESTYYFYIEQFDVNYISSVFFEETNLLCLAKQFKFPHVEPEDPKNLFNLNYFILESVAVGFDLNFIRKCMDIFIADDKELARYHRGVMLEYNKKLFRDSAYYKDNDYFKERFRDLRMSVNELFSMKCEPGNITFEQSFEKSLEMEKAKEAEKNKSNSNDKKASVKHLKGYDFETQKFNPFDNNPKKER